MTKEENERFVKLQKEVEEFSKNGEYEKEIDCYEQMIAIDPDNSAIYDNKGSVLFHLKKYNDAIICYDKAINLDINYPYVYYNKGMVLHSLGKYDEAIKCYDKAINLDIDYPYTYYNKGLALYNSKKYNEAIKCYDKAIKLNPKDTEAYNNQGATLSSLGRYEEAIDCYNKAIELNPNHLNAYNNKGLALYYLTKYNEVIELFNLELNTKNQNTYLILALSHIKLEHWKIAGEFFGKGNIDIIEAILKLENDDEKKYIEEIVQNLLKHQPDNYFWRVLKRTGVCENSEQALIDNKDMCDLYLKIYLEALQIITKLQVNHTIEEKVAHYTTKDSTRLLLLTKDANEEPSKFRLASTAKANDPKEGQTLFDYLYGDKQTEKSSNYRAFIGCFTFNHQSLNQFRLYGKEKGRDASGVSIVVNKDFFSSKIELTQNMRIAGQDIDDEEKDKNKLALFRCIYIDPETKAVISLGHKELYAHIREEMREEKDVEESTQYYNDEYQGNYIKTTLEEVTKHLGNLKELIKDGNVKSETVNELLLMLSHLVKHVAYKEEQECRILDIASLSGDDKDKSTTSDREVKMEIDKDYYRMFMEYDSMADYVDRLYMGNQFEDFELFRDIIKIRYNKECDLCNHPYASS